MHLLLVFLVFALPAAAHHEAATGGPGIAGPIITFPARTLDKDKFFVSSSLKYTNFKTFSRSQERSLLRRRETTGQINSLLLPSLNMGYGVTDDFDIYLNLPYSFKYGLTETDAGELSQFGDSIGLGDLTVLSQYRFYKNYRKKLFSSALFGLSVPTGKDDVRNNQGEFFGNDDQPGSGSWDPYLGLALTKELSGATSFDTNILYRLSTPGPRSSVVGDSLNYNFAFSYAVPKDDEISSHHHVHNHSSSLSYHDHHHHHGHHEHHHGRVAKYLAKIFPDKFLSNDLTWNLVSELNYAWQERPEFQGVKEDNHGGHSFQVTEGIRAIVNDDLVVNLAVSLPVLNLQYGAQPDPLPSIFFGISYLF